MNANYIDYYTNEGKGIVVAKVQAEVVGTEIWKLIEKTVGINFVCDNIPLYNKIEKLISPVVAMATCAPEDEFSADYGKTLAKSRLYNKVEHKKYAVLDLIADYLTGLEDRVFKTIQKQADRIVISENKTKEILGE